jgi:hypothetical protein
MARCTTGGSPDESTIMSRDKNSHLRLADRPADYQKLGIDPVEVAQFEDGQRIGTEKGRYEWWYFDAHLDDGATVVVVFYTKPNVSPNGPLAPRITINLTLPDGRRFDKLYDAAADQFTASKEGAMCGSEPIALSVISVATALRLPLRKYLSRSN